jgi:hypothetical protein
MLKVANKATTAEIRRVFEFKRANGIYSSPFNKCWCENSSLRPVIKTLWRNTATRETAPNESYPVMDTQPEALEFLKSSEKTAAW